jgi:hypothetical protein
MPRFIVNETFTDEDTGVEYAQGAIYETDSVGADKLSQWIAEDKIRDPDLAGREPDDDDVEKTIDEAKAKHEDDDDEDDEDEDEPA